MTGPAPAPPARLRSGPGRAAILCSCMVAMLLVAVNGIDLGSPPSAMQSVGTVLTIIVGALLVVRVPRNAVGWLMWVAGLFNAVTLGFGGLAAYGLVGDPGSVPGAVWLAWVSAWTGVVPLLLLAGFLPLVFPTGRLLSPRWRVAVFVGVASLALQVAAAMVGPGVPGVSYPAGEASPILVPEPARELVAVLGGVGQLLGGLLLVASVLAVVIRFRSSVGVERQQLKWFAWAALVVAVALIGAVAFTAAGPADSIAATACWLLMFSGIALLPIAIGVAVLRYRLYEIDRLVSRTIGYAVVTAILVGSFAGAVVLLQALLAPFTGESAVAVAGSTLLVAALFAPLRARVQRAVDRRFNRARYDAERTVEAFAGRLRDEVELEAVTGEMVRAVARTVEPASAAIWLRP